jgi:hypothetical protein
MKEKNGKFSTAAGRWVIENYTTRGDVVLDPFAGRGTTVFSAAISGRRGIGIEINPVGWVYAQAKLRPATESAVVRRLTHIAGFASRYRRSAQNAPVFFRWCYSRDVLEYLLAARSILDWRHCKTDWTVMAFILVNLHGKLNGALSNQMRQTKSMSPAYAINWWRERNLKPPEIDTLAFLSKRVTWRYAKGKPQVEGSQVYLGDSTRLLSHIPSYWSDNYKRVRLLLTSPPYYGVTNYHYDQWLRLWMLGGPPTSRRTGGLHKGKFENKQQYRQLLQKVFSQAKSLLRRDAVVYVRTDRRQLTLEITTEVLREVFHDRQLRYKHRPYTRPTQTNLFGHSEPRIGETDIVLTR